MDTIEHLVKALEVKVKSALEKVKVLQDENDTLKEKLAKSDLSLSVLKNDFSDLVDQYNSLKTANSLLGSNKNAREAKLKINALIKDIDLCISQLSD